MLGPESFWSRSGCLVIFLCADSILLPLTKYGSDFLEQISHSFPGQTWTMAMINYILQANELEEGKTITITDLFKNIPFIESEELDGRVLKMSVFHLQDS